MSTKIFRPRSLTSLSTKGSIRVARLKQEHPTISRTLLLRRILQLDNFRRYKKNRRKRSRKIEDPTLKHRTTLAFIVTTRGRDSKPRDHLHHLYTISSSLSSRIVRILLPMWLKASNKWRRPWIGLKKRASTFLTPTLPIAMMTTEMKMKISLMISLSSTARSKRQCLLSWSQSTMSKLNGPNNLAR